MFEGFDIRRLAVGDVTIRARIGGAGSPLLLLHGHPQTHVMWHRVAPRLAERHTIVAADLRGYGASSGPAGDPQHLAYSKRTMAGDCVALMASLGFDAFGVAGHDRGGRVAYRLALDHPDSVTRLAVLDIVPTAEMWRFAAHHGKDFGLTNWHWFFLAQDHDRPERIINAAPHQFYFGRSASIFDPEALADYRRAVEDPMTLHAMCEDYRAGATVDQLVDEQDLAAGRHITCPLLALWSAREELPRWFDVLDVWRRWAADVSGEPIDAGHFLAEEAPDQVAAALEKFFI